MKEYRFFLTTRCCDLHRPAESTLRPHSSTLLGFIISMEHAGHLTNLPTEMTPECLISSVLSPDEMVVILRFISYPHVAQTTPKLIVWHISGNRWVRLCNPTGWVAGKHFVQMTMNTFSPSWLKVYLCTLSKRSVFGFGADPQITA